MEDTAQKPETEEIYKEFVNARNDYFKLIREKIKINKEIQDYISRIPKDYDELNQIENIVQRKKERLKDLDGVIFDAKTNAVGILFRLEQLGLPAKIIDDFVSERQSLLDDVKSLLDEVNKKGGRKTKRRTNKRKRRSRFRKN